MKIELPNGVTTRILPLSERAGGVVIQNRSGVDIYLGGEDVSAYDDYMLADGQQLALSDGGGTDLSLRTLHAFQESGGVAELYILTV